MCGSLKKKKTKRGGRVVVVVPQWSVATATTKCKARHQNKASKAKKTTPESKTRQRRLSTKQRKRIRETDINSAAEVGTAQSVCLCDSIPRESGGETEYHMVVCTHVTYPETYGS